MHELTLLRSIIGKIETIASENNTDRVVSVKVQLGALAHISPEHFREHFDQAVIGTVAEGSTLEIELLEDKLDPRAQEIILDSVEVEEL